MDYAIASNKIVYVKVVHVSEQNFRLWEFER